MDSIFKPFAIFVKHPKRILLVAALFAALWFVVWNSQGRGTSRAEMALLIPTVAWLLYAIWEWAVNRSTPEADIRVDMLLIIPIVIIATIAGIVMALGGRS